MAPAGPDPRSAPVDHRLMTLLRDLIEIPTEVHKGDFVMTLRDGVGDPAGTLERYVVTEQLVGAYDNALGFVASAVREGRSKAAYLDGSFGSGKSHFMAVLGLLLAGNAQARAIGELAETIAKHDPDLHQRSFDLVPVHMIGAETMEQRVFGGYLEHLDRVDPDAPPPALFADAPILAEAARLRAQQGDEPFLGVLNTASAGAADAGWGELAAAWTATTYDDAAGAPPGDARRSRLVGDLVATHLAVVRATYRGAESGWVDFDLGLSEMARHASSRGHDALVLFLDELILWLGTRMADAAFVAREGPKLSKLVEFTVAREIPIVAFVARQRDLREFVDEAALGADKLSFADALRHWNDRFHTVSLTDRNLPKIAARRLLVPKDAAAAQTLAAAFADLERTRAEVLAVLRGDEADREQFRETYPFSPAFMATLVAASSVLQRERTALRVMLLLLVTRRDELAVGDLVGVGELFDILSSGDEPFADDLKRLFDQAKGLYRDQLRPLLEAEHAGDVTGRGFAADDRLVKTLLLAALVPNAAPLRDLDVAKLTALNHGSIATPIAGAEQQVVLQKVRRWQAGVPALKVGADAQNPTVTVRLTGVDVEAILVRAESVDRPGVRRQLVRRLVFAELGIADGQLTDEHEVLWRGTHRRVDIVFANVRDEAELAGDALRARDGRWKVVVDYPFDEPGHSPDEDLDRLERWRSEHQPTRTVCWIPAFFSASLQSELKRLVLADHVLEGERLDQFAADLSASDRLQARGLLEDLRGSLEQRVLTAIRQAYGVERSAAETVEDSHDVAERLQSLTPDFRAQIPIGARLADAFSGLVGQMLDVQYPGHPRFEDEIRPRDLRAVWEVVAQAVDAGGRIESVPSDRRRLMRRVVNPLELGTQHEAPFVLDERWKERLDRSIALARERDGELALTVGAVRTLIDEPTPIGLPAAVANLVILTYAAQSGRTFRLHGGEPGALTVDRLDDALELVTARLPAEAAWKAAVAHAPAVFGLGSINPARSPTSVEALAAALRAGAATHREGAGRALAALEGRADQLGLGGSVARVRTARAARDLVEAIVAAADAVAVVEALADADVPTTAQALGAALASAQRLADALGDDRWMVLDPAIGAARPEIVGGLSGVLEQDEFAAPLAPAIAAAYAAAIPPAPTPPPPGGGSADGLTVEQAHARLDELPAGTRVDLRWTTPS